MLSRHKQTLIRLFEQCHKIYADPQGSGDICLEVQETLIRKITYIESRIRGIKKIIKMLLFFYSPYHKNLIILHLTL